MKSPLGPFPPSLPAGLITGSGTPNTIPIWTGAQTLGDSLMTQVGGVVFLNAHLEFSKPTLQPYRFTTAFSNTQLALQGQTSGQITALHFFNKDGDGTDNVELSLFGVGTPASTGNRERIRWYFNAATNSYYFTTQASGTGVLRALWLGTYNAGKVQIKCNPDNSLDLFEQSVAPETPEFRISGRNATDSVKRTLIVNIHPTIDNCVLFSNVGKYCFDDNIDIIRASAGLITFSSAVTGDSDFRFRLNADGKIQWGGGGGAPDTSLERTGVGVLKLTGQLNVKSNNPLFIEMINGNNVKLLQTGTAIFGWLSSGGLYTMKWDVSNGAVGIGGNDPVSGLEIATNAGGSNKGYVTMGELSGDAAAPTANKGVLYLKDVGGKTAMYARFPTGAVQQIAIEP